MWGYAEIGARLASAGAPDHAGYAAWIATYADPEFQALAAWARELTDAAGADAGPGARARMHAAFRASSEHELAFWESGLERCEPRALRGCGPARAGASMPAYGAGSRGASRAADPRRAA